MFDTETAQLIRSAPGVEGIDPERLPEFLTECFTLISTVRLRITEGGLERGSELTEKLQKLRMLSFALEVFAALTDNTEQREAAAFVSATAHQLLGQAIRLIPNHDQTPTALTSTSIPSELAAALLFLAAGYPADAAEAIISLPQIDNVDRRNGLLLAVCDLCSGDLRSLQTRQLSISDDLAGEERADQILYRRIFIALQRLGRRFQSRQIDRIAEMALIRQELESVMRDSVSSYELPNELNIPKRIVSTFAGPHHLAALLLAAGFGMNERALIDIPTPEGPDEAAWNRFLDKKISARPFIWTNHKDAISAGMLNTGVSSVISFPTGAGKSTLSELKIAVTVLNGRKVIYLAPTLALVSQVSRNLRDVLSDAEVDEDEIEDQIFSVPEEAIQRAVSVMTPERCLLLLTIFPEAFEDVGLIVFDECHFLHMPQGSTSPRPISAMFSLLRLLEGTLESDVMLMSAMMTNPEHLAGWLNSTFGRNTLVFNAAWKPTRQARGSVVFSNEDIVRLIELIPPIERRIPRKDLLARPYSLFSLEQTWTSDDLEDYCLVPLLNEPVQFNGDRTALGRPLINLDTSECAISIALRAANQGLRTIVFFHISSSIFKGLREAQKGLQTPELELTSQENKLYEAATLELGDSRFVVVPNKMAGGHFGHLLREERELVESSFKRPDGPKILFSTNTLAQGINLPADLVIIVRVKSYNVESGGYENIQVHDILNAAGRAGRAGHSSNGTVLVIPDRIISFNNRNQVSGNGLGHLKDGLLAQDDRCLEIADPIEVLLDRLTVRNPEEEFLINYLLLRLPTATDDADSRTRGREFFGKSLASYRASEEGRADDFNHKANAALNARETIMGQDISRTVEAMCSGTGLPPIIVSAILEKLSTLPIDAALSAQEWVDWIMDIVEQVEGARRYLLKSTIVPEGALTREMVNECLGLWLLGHPLVEIELARGIEERKLGYLKNARKFSRDTVGELSYAISLIAQIATAANPEEWGSITRSATLASKLVREGFDTFEKWILHKLYKEELWTRVKVHQESHDLLRLVEAGPPDETMKDSFRRVAQGVQRALAER